MNRTSEPDEQTCLGTINGRKVKGQNRWGLAEQEASRQVSSGRRTDTSELNTGPKVREHADLGACYFYRRIRRISTGLSRSAKPARP